MKKAIIIIVLVCLSGVLGCKPYQMSEQDKAKVAELKTELSTINTEIEVLKKEIRPNDTSVVNVLRNCRLETYRLTVALLEQQIAAIETGAKVTITVPGTQPNPEKVKEIENDIQETKIEIKLAQKESEQYTGGLIKSTIEARKSIEEFTLASLEHQKLHYKYGLYTPIIKKDNTDKTEAKTDNKPQVTASENKQVTKKVIVEDPGPFDVRRARFGMTQQEVVDREEITLTPFNDSLVGEDKTLGKSSQIHYLFDGNKLWRVGIFFTEKYVNKNNYVDNFFNVIKALKEKYGKPKTENTYWSDTLYQNDFENRGMAYASGMVTTTIIWEKEDLQILAKLDGENFEIRPMVTYSSKKLEKIYREKQKKEQSKDI